MAINLGGSIGGGLSCMHLVIGNGSSTMEFSKQCCAVCKQGTAHGLSLFTIEIDLTSPETPIFYCKQHATEEVRKAFPAVFGDQR